jgi:DinB superfamily
MMTKISWFERQFTFGLPKGMFPFYIERLDGTFARMREKTKDLSEAMLSNKLDGKWSVKENIAHLHEVGKISDNRINEIVGGAEVMSPAMLPLTVDYNSLSINDILGKFMTTRKNSLTRYLRLQEDDLGKTSIHPRLKVPMTAVDLAWFDAEHDDHHLVRINEIIASLNQHKV